MDVDLSAARRFALVYKKLHRTFLGTTTGRSSDIPLMLHWTYEKIYLTRRTYFWLARWLAWYRDGPWQQLWRLGDFADHGRLIPGNLDRLQNRPELLVTTHSAKECQPGVRLTYPGTGQSLVSYLFYASPV